MLKNREGLVDFHDVMDVVYRMTRIGMNYCALILGIIITYANAASDDLYQKSAQNIFFLAYYYYVILDIHQSDLYSLGQGCLRS